MPEFPCPSRSIWVKVHLIFCLGCLWNIVARHGRDFFCVKASTGFCWKFGSSYYLCRCVVNTGTGRSRGYHWHPCLAVCHILGLEPPKNNNCAGPKLQSGPNNRATQELPQLQPFKAWSRKSKAFFSGINLPHSSEEGSEQARTPPNIHTQRASYGVGYSIGGVRSGRPCFPRISTEACRWVHGAGVLRARQA